MLSECVLVARWDVFDVQGGIVRAKRSVLIGITLKSGLWVYRQHCGVKGQFANFTHFICGSSKCKGLTGDVCGQRVLD